MGFIVLIINLDKLFKLSILSSRISFLVSNLYMLCWSFVISIFCASKNNRVACWRREAVAYYRRHCHKVVVGAGCSSDSCLDAGPSGCCCGRCFEYRCFDQNRSWMALNWKRCWISSVSASTCLGSDERVVANSRPRTFHSLSDCCLDYYDWNCLVASGVYETSGYRQAQDEDSPGCTVPTGGRCFHYHKHRIQTHFSHRNCHSLCFERCLLLRCQLAKWGKES